MSAQLADLKQTVASAGFGRWIRARGLWVLSGSGEIQVEEIWIGCRAQPDTRLRQILPSLALFIKDATNQDSVAWEEEGILRFL